MIELERLERLFREGKIDRRAFVRQLSLIGLSVVATSIGLSETAAAGTPKKGGVFKIAMTGGSTTDSLDSATLTSNHNINVTSQIRNYLVEIDHKFKPIPELAESWEASPDAKVWTFKLRKGVEFHNGKTMTADDVVYSINHHRGEKSKSGGKPLVKAIESIKKDGKYTVVFELNGGNADFPFSMGDYHLPIVPDGTKGVDWEKGIGTGGYILENWEPGVRAITRRNPNYWKAGRAHFDSVETLAITDVNARTNALKTGQIHHMDRVEVKTAHLLKRTPGIDVTSVTGTMHYSIPMLVDHKPYDNPNVRMALKFAVDRKQMVEKILRGYGELGNDHPIASVNRYHAGSIEQRQFDPDKARFYMKKAGMLGHTFNLHAGDAAFSGAVDAAVLLKESAKKAGIKINVVREPSDGYWSNVWMKKPWSMCYWSGRPTEDMMFSTAYAADASWNDSHWKNKRFNELLIKARAELNQKKRRAMYAEMQQICRDDGGVIIPMYNKIVEAESKKLAHGPISAHMEMDGQRNTERWWFA